MMNNNKTLFLLLVLWSSTVGVVIANGRNGPPNNNRRPTSVRDWFAVCLNVRRPSQSQGGQGGGGGGQGGGMGGQGGATGRADLPDGADNRTLADRIDCIRRRVGNPTCLNAMENTTTIGQCVQENMQADFPMVLENFHVMDDWEAIRDAFPNFNGFARFERAAINTLVTPCLDDYKPCIRESVRNAVDNMRPCVNETLREFAACGREYGGQCRDLCDSTFPNATELFGDLSRNQVASCQRIQTNLMDPVCEDLVCCGQCVEAYEKVVRCVVSDMLNFPRFKVVGGQSNPNRPCAECLDSNSRLLLQLDEAESFHRILTDDPADSYIFDECAELTPGLFATDGENDDEVLSLHTEFFACVTNAFFEEVESSTDGSSSNNEPTTGSPPTQPSPMATPTQAPTSGGFGPVATLRFVAVAMILLVLYW